MKTFSVFLLSIYILLSIFLSACGLIPNPAERVYLPSGALREVSSRDQSVKFLEYRYQSKLSRIDGIVPVDIFNHGINDLVVVGAADSAVEVLRNLGDGTFQYFSKKSICVAGNDIDTGDFNGDGFSDLIVNCTHDSKIQIFYGNGRGDFNLQEIVVSPAVIGISTPANYGSPGTNQFSLLKDKPSELDILFRNPSGEFDQKKSLPLSPAPSRLVSDVFTRDGAVSYVIASEVNSIFSVFINHGGDYEKNDYSTIQSPSDFDTVDFRNNGYKDLILTSANIGNFRIYENDGNGKFPQFREYSIPHGTASIVGITHLKAERKPELTLQSNQTGDLFIYSNLGGNSFLEPQSVSLGGTFMGATTGAFVSKQGDLDLALIDSQKNEVVILLNEKQM